MSGPLEIKVGRFFTLRGAPGESVTLFDGDINTVTFAAADVPGLAEALQAFVVQPAEPPREKAKQPQAVECRSCGALMFWAVTPAARKMPVDAGPTVDGTLVLSLRGGQLHIDTWRADEPSHAAPRRRYTSHFATCVHAGEHRRAR